MNFLLEYLLGGHYYKLNEMSGISEKEHPRWAEKWNAGIAPGETFDMACPLPALVKMVDENQIPYGRALVPGCGRGYDVTLLAAPNRTAIGLDISEVAIAAATERYNSLPDEERPPPESAVFISTSFFDLPEDDNSKFDFVYDYTFLSALDPSIRPDWAAKMAAIVKAGGELCTIIFPIGDRPGGPPFQVTIDDYKNLLEPVGFTPFQLEMLPPELCHRGRAGDYHEATIKRFGVPVSTAIGRWRKNE